MKKRKYGKGLTILAILSFLVACVEGYIYYSAYERFGLFRVIMTLQNSFKAFLFTPSISSEAVLRTLVEEGPGFRLYVGLAYVVACFTAQLCTATAMVAAVESLVRKSFNMWSIRRQEAMLIFGYNDDVKLLLKNQWSKGDKASCTVIHLVADVELSEQESLDLVKQNVYFHRMDFVCAAERTIKHFLKTIRSQNIVKIMLLEESSMRNVSLYLRLCELCGSRAKQTEESGAQKTLPFGDGTVCCCCCAENHARELVSDYYDVEKPALDLILFDLAQLRVRKALDAVPLWSKHTVCAGQPVNRADAFDVHILITGFGSVGEQMLRQCLNQSVAHSQSNIRIDVVDHVATKKMKLFFSSLELNDCFVDETTLRIEGVRGKHSLADGCLTIRFHDMDARENRFSRLLREISKETPITYAAVCIRDLDVAIQCVSAIEHLAADRPFPIVVKLEGSEQLARYLEKNNSSYGDVFIMDGTKQDHLLCLDDIYRSTEEKKAKQYHELYRMLHFGPEGETFTPGKEWNDLKLYQQEANRLLHYHTEVKEHMLCCAAGSIPENQNERKRLVRKTLMQHLNAVGITKKAASQTYVYSTAEDKLLQRLEEDPVLGELMRTEHRRWCYTMLFAGWSGNCAKKNEQRRESPYICDWESLDAAVKKYDLMPALMMAIEDTEDNP